jgi:hypothetical protein
MKGLDRYRVEGVPCRIDGRLFEVVNMSVGGLFVAAEAGVYSVGNKLQVALILPNQAPVEMAGVVAWINEANAPRVPALPSGFGVRLVRVGFTDRMALLTFLGQRDPGLMRRS